MIDITLGIIAYAISILILMNRHNSFMRKKKQRAHNLYPANRVDDLNC